MSEVEDWNRKIITEFRANEGKVGGPFAGAPVLLLHTTGARTRRERVNPMMYLDLDGHRYVFATAAGADKNPDWYWNLVAHPERDRRGGDRNLRGQSRVVGRRRAESDLRRAGTQICRIRRVRADDQSGNTCCRNHSQRVDGLDCVEPVATNSSPCTSPDVSAPSPILQTFVSGSGGERTTVNGCASFKDVEGARAS